MGDYAINARTLNSISVHVARLFTAKARTDTHKHAQTCTPMCSDTTENRNENLVLPAVDFGAANGPQR